MKLNNCPNVTENESGSVDNRHEDKQKDILEHVLAKPIASTRYDVDTGFDEVKSVEKIDGVIIGKVTSCDDSGAVMVDYADNPCSRPLRAASIEAIGTEDINKDVVLTFEAGDPERPVIVGRLRHSFSQAEKTPVEAVDIQLNGKRLKFNAEQEIVLRCGEASITLTRAGKVIIRGEYLLSRSTGTNRIKGGSVQIN